MSKINKKYFSTGEFAKLCNINKKTLFHYDEIGLFKPEKVLENGYRYYSTYQLEVFNVIYTLKDIGMPLKEIKNFMDKRNPDNIVEIFEYETSEIQKEIEKLKRKQEIISNKIKIIKESKNISQDIFLQHQEEEYIILSNNIDKTKEPYDTYTYMNHLDYCYNNNLYIGYPAGSIKTLDDLNSTNPYDYSYYYTKVNKNPNNKNITIKPEGDYVVGYFKGYFSQAHIFYEKLMSYINKNNLTVVGYAYEDVLIDEVAIKNINEYVLKISIQIK